MVIDWEGIITYLPRLAAIEEMLNKKFFFSLPNPIPLYLLRRELMKVACFTHYFITLLLIITLVLLTI